VDGGLDGHEACETEGEGTHGGADYRSIFGLLMRAAKTQQSEAATLLPTWTAGPRDPQLEPGTVHVWRCQLSSVEDTLLDLLAPAERAREQRFFREDAGRTWALSRAVLRALLGRYLRCNAANVSFRVGSHGKPALAASRALSFNLSHSQGTALYAFSTTEVGVDVEHSRPGVDQLASIKRVLGAAEAARLERLDPTSRERELLRAWVRHEAALKCVGVGLWGEAAGTSEPWLCQLDLGEAAAGAVAVAKPPNLLQCWEWQPRTAEGGRR
jgi:4'-phosphopantetheinyl transferase